MPTFTPQGWRRLIVAVVAVLTCGAVEWWGGQWGVHGSLALSAIVLGYFGFDAQKKKNGE